MPSVLRSLRGQVVIGVAMAWLLVVIVAYASFFPRVRARLVTAQEEQAVRVAEGIAAEVSTTLGAALEELTAISELEALRSTDRRELDALLEQMQATSPFFLHLTVLSPDGTITSRPILPEHVGESRADRPYARAIQAGRVTFVGEPRMSSLDTVSLNVAARIETPDGFLHGMLMGALGAADRNRVVYSPIVSPVAPEAWRVFLVSGEGYLLAHSEREIVPDEGLAGIDFREHPACSAELGSVIRYGDGDLAAVTAVAGLPSVRWRVGVEIPEAVFDAPVAEAITDLLVTTSLAAVMMLLVGVFMAGRVTKRVTALTTGLSRQASDSELDLLPEASQDEIGDAIAAYNRMISERRRLRDELRLKDQSLLQAGKLEALGRLTGGVAHDFNNLLTVILGYAQLVRPGEPDAEEDIAKITDAAEQARALSGALLAFGRTREAVAEAVDLNEVIADARSLLDPLMGASIDLWLKTADEPVLVSGDRHQLQQIVVNLAINARDATSKGGWIEIGVEVRPDDPILGPDIAVLYVEDDGTGMDPAQVKLIFEPFYTTKPPGEGTGLGLSMARAFMEQVGGRIAVQTEVGVGTRFDLCFPLLTDGTAEGEVTPAQGTAPDAKPLHIVLVEDQEAVRTLTARFLSEAGHDVRATETAEEAIDLIEAMPVVDVLLSDINLPGMSGLELARRFVEERPAAAIVLMSGNVSPREDELERIRPDVEFIPKPFSQDSLVDRVQQSVRRRRSAGS